MQTTCDGFCGAPPIFIHAYVLQKHRLVTACPKLPLAIPDSRRSYAESNRNNALTESRGSSSIFIPNHCDSFRTLEVFLGVVVGIFCTTVGDILETVDLTSQCLFISRFMSTSSGPPHGNPWK